MSEAMRLAVETLQRVHKLLVVTHRKPDGDAFGTALALTWTLRANGKEADCLLCGEIPIKYREFADGYLTGIRREELAAYDCVVIVDTARTSMVETGELPVEALWDRPVLNIDHHPDNSVQGTWNCVMPETAAAAEAVWLIVESLKWQVPTQAATLFLIGLITDTGGFRFANTGAEALKAAAGMLQAGADLIRINNQVFFSKPLNQQRLEAELILHELHICEDKRLAWAVITPELLRKFDFDMRDGEGVIERIREIDGVLIAALIYPRNDGVKVSLRAQDPRYPVGPVARANGGGGHEMAAGITLENMNARQAAALLIPQLEALLEA